MIRGFTDSFMKVTSRNSFTFFRPFFLKLVLLPGVRSCPKNVQNMAPGHFSMRKKRNLQFRQNRARNCKCCELFKFGSFSPIQPSHLLAPQSSGAGKPWKDPWCDIFLKRKWYEDFKNNVTKCRTSKYIYTNTQILQKFKYASHLTLDHEVVQFHQNFKLRCSLSNDRSSTK